MPVLAVRPVRFLLILSAFAALLALAACGAEAPTVTPALAPPTETPVATAAPMAAATDTPAPPTLAPAPPTDTAAPPTAAPASPTESPVPPTAAPAPTDTTAPVAPTQAPTTAPAPPTRPPATKIPTPRPPTPRPATAVPTPRPTTAPAPGAVYVNEVDFAFDPPAITIPRGTKVIWTNVGPTDHTVADADITWSSDILHKNDKYTYTFTTPGTVKVICSLHPDMVMTVTVK